jgi:hypothetical protein
MNAYKLADKLETDAWDEATIVQSIHLGIKMLRQQADRIAELEKEKIKAYDNGFEDGQKALTTNTKEEPVSDYLQNIRKAAAAGEKG